MGGSWRGQAIQEVTEIGRAQRGAPVAPEACSRAQGRALLENVETGAMGLVIQQFTGVKAVILPQQAVFRPFRPFGDRGHPSLIGRQPGNNLRRLRKRIQPQYNACCLDDHSEEFRG